MAEQNKQVSYNQPKEDTTRGNTAVINANSYGQGVQMGVNPISGKSASKSATKQFGAQNEQVITLEPDFGQSKGAKNANYAKIEVVPSQQEAAAVSLAPKMEYNDISTRLVQGMDCGAALQHLNKVLAAYSQEIEFQVDSTKAEAPEITDGIVFVDNYYAVHFKVYIFDDADTDGVRIEFRRKSGNALAASKFLGAINSAFSLSARAKRESTGNLFVDAVVAATEQAVRDSLSKSSLSHDIEVANAPEQDTMVALDTNFDGLELKMNEEQQERMMIHEALLDDQVVGDLDESAENYLFAKLVEQKAISKDDVVDHDQLVQVLMSRQSVLHQDVAVVRASYLILQKLVATHSAAMANGQFMNIVAESMKTAQYGLVRQFAYNFLCSLAEATRKGDWKLDAKTKAALKAQIEGVNSEEMKGFAVMFE